jgi:hypothetical protein
MTQFLLAGTRPPRPGSPSEPGGPGGGVIIAGMSMQVRERDCPETVGRRDHIVEAALVGTAIARFARAGPPPAGPALAIMSLGPPRRRAATLRM